MWEPPTVLEALVIKTVQILDTIWLGRRTGAVWKEPISSRLAALIDSTLSLVLDVV